jgi:hypothetical protein
MNPYRLLAPARVLVPLALFILVAVPALRAAEIADVAPSSITSNPAILAQLEAAKHRDWDAALDPAVAPVTQEDFLEQMNKADRAIKELEHGFTVSPDEITDALWAPPKSITPAERSRLIQELLTARQQDEHNEREMMNDTSWDDYNGPYDTVKFDQQKELVDSVVKDLEIEEGVHWSTIKEALYVPQD